MHRDFKGVWIPKAVYLHPALSWTEKILLTEIHSLERQDGCFASNEYLSEFLQVGVGRTANLISQLKAAGFVRSEGHGHRRRLFVEPSLFSETPSRKSETSSRKSERLSRKSETPIYRINNTEINTENTSYLSAHPADAGTPDPEPKRVNGTRIREDFRPDDKSLEWAAVRTPDIDLDHHTEVFLNYWLSATGQRAKKMDWQLTWRNWMLKEQEAYGKNRFNNQPRQLTYEQSLRDALAIIDAEFPE